MEVRRYPAGARRQTPKTKQPKRINSGEKGTSEGSKPINSDFALLSLLLCSYYFVNYMARTWSDLQVYVLSKPSMQFAFIMIWYRIWFDLVRAGSTCRFMFGSSLFVFLFNRFVFIVFINQWII